MIYFGKYLKDYLEYSNISQTEFAMRMGITQKAYERNIKWKNKYNFRNGRKYRKTNRNQIRIYYKCRKLKNIKRKHFKTIWKHRQLKKEIT